MGNGSPDANHPDWWATLIHESGHTVIALHFGFEWRGTQIGTGAEAFGAAMLRDPRGVLPATPDEHGGDMIGEDRLVSIVS